MVVDNKLNLKKKRLFVDFIVEVRNEVGENWSKFTSTEDTVHSDIESIQV